METILNQKEMEQITGGDHYEYIFDEKGDIIAVIYVKD
jgi:bacteriocin-like protein